MKRKRSRAGALPQPALNRRGCQRRRPSQRPRGQGQRARCPTGSPAGPSQRPRPKQRSQSSTAPQPRGQQSGGHDRSSWHEQMYPSLPIVGALPPRVQRRRFRRTSGRLTCRSALPHVGALPPRVQRRQFHRAAVAWTTPGWDLSGAVRPRARSSHGGTRAARAARADSSSGTGSRMTARSTTQARLARRVRRRTVARVPRPLRRDFRFKDPRRAVDAPARRATHRRHDHLAVLCLGREARAQT
jgi:hypothetical protein